MSAASRQSRPLRPTLRWLISLLSFTALALPCASAASPVTPTTHAGTASWREKTTRVLAPVSAPDLPDVLQRASEILPMLAAAVNPRASTDVPDPASWALHPTLGAALSAYAKNIGADPGQFENFEAAARRILAGTTTGLRTPDATSRWLEETAVTLLAAVQAAEAAPAIRRLSTADTAAVETALADLKVLALYSRFHAHRILAAVHYNLFLRGQRLAELYAGTLEARTGLALWRDLVTTFGNRSELTLPLAAKTITTPTAPWREELTRLGYDVTDLEAQCCPPDEAMIREKVWTPRPAS